MQVGNFVRIPIEVMEIEDKMTKKQLLYAAALDAPQFTVEYDKVGNVAVDVTKADGFPTQVCLEITYNNAPRTWLSPEDARGLAEMLLAAADVAEKASN